MQVAIKTGIEDRFASLNAQISAGRAMRPVPFDNVHDLLSALDDLSLNQTVASPSSRLTGGGAPMMTRSKTHTQSLPRREVWGR